MSSIVGNNTGNGTVNVSQCQIFRPLRHNHINFRVCLFVCVLVCHFDNIEAMYHPSTNNVPDQRVEQQHYINAMQTLANGDTERAQMETGEGSSRLVTNEERGSTLIRQQRSQIIDLSTGTVELHPENNNEILPQSTPVEAFWFYYVGVADFIRCYFCEGGIMNWNNSVPIATRVHAMYYTNCQQSIQHPRCASSAETHNDTYANTNGNVSTGDETQASGHSALPPVTTDSRSNRSQAGEGNFVDSGICPSLQEQMHYEWIRLASFQHYTGEGNALNLARNGFYHRHTDGPTSTRCAYCDETRSNWEYFDNIEAVHRQISPNCPFHEDHSEESLNVPINCDGPRSTISEAANQNSEPSTSENSAVKTYTLRPSLNLASAVDEVARGLENTSVSQEKPSKTNGESVSQQPTEDPEGRERRTGERVSGLTRTSSNTALPPVTTESRSNRAQAGAGNFVDPKGKHAPQSPAPVIRDSTPTTLENVKHPEYRTMDQRVNSFQGFPDYLDQTPEQMALAGFYFIGVADYTRCFCCGGGLKNWEAGDDPLLEHIRWFPRCEYVLRLKRKRYVEAVQRRCQEHMEQHGRQQIEIANQGDANRNPPDPMTTDVASVMREMGYVDQRIRETILEVRRQIGTHVITTQQVLSWLLGQDDDSTTTTDAARELQAENKKLRDML